MKTILRKLKVSLSGSDLEKYPKLFESTVSAISGTALDLRIAKCSDLQKSGIVKIQFMVEAADGVISKYGMMNYSGTTIIAGDDGRGYYIYDPNTLYEFPASQLNVLPNDTTLAGAYSYAGAVTGSGDVTLYLWVTYK